MEDIFFNILYSQELSYLIRLIVATSLGILIGHDRTKRGSPAGIKTHSLVCIGSCLVMITGDYCFREFSVGDVTRLAAQVVSGIGFLGAGTIIVTGKNRVKGLTTAAGIWFCACVGLAIGAGFYFGGIIAALIEILLLKKFYYYGSGRIVDILIEFDTEFEITKYVETLKATDCKLLDVQSDDLTISNKNVIIATIELFGKQIDETLIANTIKVKGVKGAIIL